VSGAQGNAAGNALGAVAPRVDGLWDHIGLPMPHNPSLLDPQTPRLRVRTVEDRFPFPIPNGWFVVACSDELAAGATAALHYFGRDLVLYRGESGTPFLVDAYCPHLGAHLAVGGKVEGDCIRCPFHGWRYAGSDGRCDEIPYGGSERIPPKARLRAYRCLERGGAIWAWHDLNGAGPFYELPLVAEMDDPGWTVPLMREFRIATSCQEMAENNHDVAHFQYVHGTASIPEGEEVIDGTYKSVKNPGLERETFGLGLGVVRLPGALTFVSSVTPIDRENVHVRWFFSVPSDAPSGSVEFFADAFTAGVTQDIPIWENKIYRSLSVQNRWVVAPAEPHSGGLELPPIASLEVVYRTAPELVRAVVPPPLVAADDGKVHLRFTDIDLDFGGGVTWQEHVGWFGVDVTFDGRSGEYPLLIPIDMESAIAVSRERHGEPEKLAEISIERKGNDVSASMTRQGVTFAEVTGVVTRPASVPGPSETRQFWFKFMPAVSGVGFDGDVLLVQVDQTRTPVTVEEVDAKVVLRDLPSAPLADLPVEDVLSVVWTTRRATTNPRVVGPVDPVAFAPFAAARYG